MTEKTKAQIDREKQAVAAMSNAKANMDSVLARVTTLEYALSNACSALSLLKRHVGPDSKMEWRGARGEQRDFVTKYVDEQIAAIAIKISK